MDPENLGGFGRVRMVRLSASNFSIWKQKVNMIFTYWKVDNIVAKDNPHKNGTSEYTS